MAVNIGGAFGGTIAGFIYDATGQEVTAHSGLLQL